MKHLSIIFSLLLVIGLTLTGCGKETSSGNATKDGNGEKLTIYTTIFPLADFAQKIGGEHVDVHSIFPPNVDGHSFEPTTKDMMKLAEADLFIYNGAGYEGFADKATEILKNEGVKILMATENVQLLESDHSHQHKQSEAGAEEDMAHSEDEHAHDDEAALSEDEHAHDDEAALSEDDHAHDEEAALSEDEHAHDAEAALSEDDHAYDGEVSHKHGNYDPHVWLDPSHAINMAESIKDALSELQPKHKQEFEDNFLSLKKELEELDQEFKSVTESSKSKYLLVAHKAYGYWAHRYGIVQIAVTGLSPTQEPSQKQLTELVKEAKVHDIHYIAFEQNVSQRVAEIIQKEIGAKPLTLHNLESITSEEIENNEDYFSLMHKNLDTLKTALN